MIFSHSVETCVMWTTQILHWHNFTLIFVCVNFFKKTWQSRNPTFKAKTIKNSKHLSFVSDLPLSLIPTPGQLLSLLLHPGCLRAVWLGILKLQCLPNFSTSKSLLSPRGPVPKVTQGVVFLPLRTIHLSSNPKPVEHQLSFTECSACASTLCSWWS